MPATPSPQGSPGYVANPLGAFGLPATGPGTDTPDHLGPYQAVRNSASLQFPSGYGTFPDPPVTGVGVLPQAKFRQLWRTALTNVNSRTVNVFYTGASVGGGVAFYSSDWMNNGVAQLISKTLQGIYGDGGSGFWPNTFTGPGPWPPSGGDPRPIVASGAGGNFYGGWDILYGYGFGASIFAHVASSGVTLTCNQVRGNTIDIYWTATTTAAQSLQYSIDGGANNTITTTVGATANSAVGITTVTGLTSGNHTVVITANAGQAGFQGITGRYATGICPVYTGVAGRSSNELTNTQLGSTNTLAQLISGTQPTAIQSQQGTNLWPMGAPDLALVSDMGGNDAVGNTPNRQFLSTIPVGGCTPPALMISNVEYLLQQYLAANSSVALAAHMLHIGKFDSASRTVTATVTSGSNLLNVTSGTLYPFDVGATVTGTGIPAIPTAVATTLLDVGVSGTANNQAVMSALGTATNTGVTVTIKAANPFYGAYSSLMRGLADAYGMHLLNSWNAGQNSWAYWQGFNMWGLNNTDSVHPNDKGHAFVASLALPYLIGS